CLYHYCGKGITTWYDFAVSIFDIAGRVGLSKIPTVVPISTAQFPTAAKRPVFSALDCSSIEEDYGIKTRPWKECLTSTIQTIMSSGTGQ
ncbi:MAG: sugar nucleotide-binding protein, partial [Desulfobacterales bacterium]